MRRYLIPILSVTAMLCLPATAADSKFSKATPELIAKGKTAYQTSCASCHGDTGDGNGPAGQYLKPKPRNFKTDPFKNGNSPDQIFASITKGLPGTAMAPFGHLGEEVRWGITHYILSMKGK